MSGIELKMNRYNDPNGWAKTMDEANKLIELAAAEAKLDQDKKTEQARRLQAQVRILEAEVAELQALIDAEEKSKKAIKVIVKHFKLPNWNRLFHYYRLPLIFTI